MKKQNTHNSKILPGLALAAATALASQASLADCVNFIATSQSAADCESGFCGTWASPWGNGEIEVYPNPDHPDPIRILDNGNQILRVVQMVHLTDGPYAGESWTFEKRGTCIFNVPGRPEICQTRMQVTPLDDHLRGLIQESGWLDFTAIPGGSSSFQGVLCLDD